MGIPVPGYSLTSPPSTFNFTEAIVETVDRNSGGLLNSEVKSALRDAVPILNGIGATEKIPNIFNYYAPSAPLNSEPGKELLVTK